MLVIIPPIVMCEESNKDHGSGQKRVDYIKHEESLYNRSGKDGYCNFIPEYFKSLISHLCLAEHKGHLGKTP